MAELSADSFLTRGGELTWQLALADEEHFPLPPEASAGMLLGNVMRRVGLVALVVDEIGWADAGADIEELVISACSRFAGLAATCVTAALRMHPDCRDASPEDRRDSILYAIDDDLASWLDDQESPRKPPDDCVRAVTSLLVGAGDALCRAEGVETVLGDETSWEELFADSMYTAAVMAARGAEMCDRMLDVIDGIDPLDDDDSDFNPLEVQIDIDFLIDDEDED